MPLLSASEFSRNTVQVLDSQVYSEGSTGAVGGVGLTEEAYLEMNRIVDEKRISLDLLETMIDNRLGEEAVGPLQMQARASAQAGLLTEIRQRVPLANGTEARFFPPTAHGKLQGHLNPAVMVDLHSVTFEVQQEARRMFTAGQQISLSKMIAEWLTLIQDLIQCATDAEKELEKVIGDINAERQAMWSLAGGVIGAVLTYSVPPPAGAILGAVVMAVCTEDTWTKCIGAGAKLGVQANKPGSPSATLGPYEIQTIYGQEKITDFKDWLPVIGGAPSCLGKSSKEVVDRINKKTLRHLTDMPAPPKSQAKDAATVIKEQCNTKMQAVLRAVGEEISDFVNSQRGPAALVHASWEYQESAITSKAKIMAATARSQFVKDRLKEGCSLYLNTVAHNILVTLAETAKPKFNRITMNAKAIKKEFEILFWATYLATSALKEPKSTSTFGSKAPKADDDDYYAYNYGTIKKLVWRSQVETKLNELGITKQFASPSKLPFAGKSAEYQDAIRNWRPPMAVGQWVPVPYQEGGTNAKGRLAAWAVEYTKRTPKELYRAIMA